MGTQCNIYLSSCALRTSTLSITTFEFLFRTTVAVISMDADPSIATPHDLSMHALLDINFMTKHSYTNVVHSNLTS